MTDTANQPQLEGEHPENHDPKVMGLLDHLDELRSRLIRSIISVIVLFFAAIAFADKIINFIKRPLASALPKGADVLHFTGPMDVFIAQIKVSFLTAIVVGAPIWLYQFWKFIEPALYPKERKYVLPFVFASVTLFIAGISFCFFVMMPMTLHFLIGMGMNVGKPIITIGDYVSLLLLLVFGFGVIFETPVILVLLAMMDLISVETLTQYRKIIIVIILVISAVLTPPDPLSQLAMAIPTYVMFEASILVIRIIKGKRTEAE